jgi:hypothetical protein
MRRILQVTLIVSMTILPYGLALADDTCQWTDYATDSQRMDDPITSYWCKSDEVYNHFKVELGLDYEEASWNNLFFLSGSDTCSNGGPLTRLINAAWMLEAVWKNNDNITDPKPVANWAEYVYLRSGKDNTEGKDNTYLADCENKMATNGGDNTHLHLQFFQVSVPFRAAVLVHEATHEDAPHVYKASVCSILLYESAMNPYLRQKYCSYDTTCLQAFGKCMDMWPANCHTSVDIGFGLENATTKDTYYMLNATDTFVKDPATNELLIAQYATSVGEVCSFVPLMSLYSYIELYNRINHYYDDCFLITPRDPVRSAYWTEFMNDFGYSLDGKIDPISTPAWIGDVWNCAQPCDPQDYLFPDGVFACNEKYQSGNKAINEANHALCEAANAAIAGNNNTKENNAQASKQFKNGKQECISGVSDEYLQTYCDEKIFNPTIQTLAQLDLNFTIDDKPGLFVPDGVYSSCAKEFCQERYQSVWTPQATQACYEWNDPLGCVDYFCGKLSDYNKDSVEYYQAILCRKSYFDSNGDAGAYAGKTSGKCNQDYMDCVAEKGVGQWLEAKAGGLCNLSVSSSSAAPSFQFHALDLATSGITYDQFTAACPNCQLHACEAKRAGCESFMNQLPDILGEFLALTRIPREVVLKEFGMPTPPRIDPEMSPIDRSLKTIVDLLAHPPGDQTLSEEIAKQFLTVPEYQNASARALGHEAFFSIYGTKGFRSIFPKETLGLYEGATLRFDFDLKPRQTELLPALTQMSLTRKRIEAPEILLALDTLSNSNPRGMFDYVNKIYRANSVREINVALDGLSVGPLQPPGVPTLLSPADGSIDVSTSPTFTWNASTEAATYRLQVATDNAFGTIVYDQDGITSISQNITGLHGGRLHYWRCSASNSAGTSSWSNVWSFTTGR